MQALQHLVCRYKKCNARRKVVWLRMRSMWRAKAVLDKGKHGDHTTTARLRRDLTEKEKEFIANAGEAGAKATRVVCCLVVAWPALMFRSL